MSCHIYPLTHPLTHYTLHSQGTFPIAPSAVVANGNTLGGIYGANNSTRPVDSSGARASLLQGYHNPHPQHPHHPHAPHPSHRGGPGMMLTNPYPGATTTTATSASAAVPGAETFLGLTLRVVPCEVSIDDNSNNSSSSSVATTATAPSSSSSSSASISWTYPSQVLPSLTKPLLRVTNHNLH